MDVRNSMKDNSTICDILLKKWLDQYTANLPFIQDRYLALHNTLVREDQNLAKLKIAESKLKSLYEPMNNSLIWFTKAVEAHDSFVTEYGDLGVHLSSPASAMHDTLISYEKELVAYSEKVQKAYFANLEKVQNYLHHLSTVCDAYNNLFRVLVAIRDNYFKTASDRRKPVIRDLYRLFTDLGKVSVNVNEPVPEGVDTTPFSKDELANLVSTCREAAKAADILKKAR